MTTDRPLLLIKLKSDSGSGSGFSQIFASGSERKTKNPAGVDSGYPHPILPLLEISTAAHPPPPGEDHYSIFRLVIRQDSEFATGYRYPKTAFKRQKDPEIQNAFIDISRIQTFGKSCTLHNHSFIIFRSIFSAFCAMTQSLYAVLYLYRKAALSNRCASEVGPDPDYRSRLRQDSVFFFRTRTRFWSQNIVQNWTHEKPDFSISAVAGVCAVIFLVKTWVNYLWIDRCSRRLNRTRMTS